MDVVVRQILGCSTAREKIVPTANAEVFGAAASCPWHLVAFALIFAFRMAYPIRELPSCPRKL